MTPYEALEHMAYENSIILLTAILPYDVNGYFYENFNAGLSTITLSLSITTLQERSSILAEELGHYFTTPSNLFINSKDLQDKYEHKAKMWAACELISLSRLVQASRLGIHTTFELADYFNVTEDFLRHSLKLLEEKYGLHTRYENYIISFNPLSVKEVI